MRYEAYQYYIICEDKNHFHFILGWLEEKGVNDRRIYPSKMPLVKGDAKKFVCSQLQTAYEHLKSKCQHTATCLIIAMDMDNKDRHEVERKINAPTNLPVFEVLPKWSIETWFYYLEGNMTKGCDESQSWKLQGQEFRPAQLGRNLAKKDVDTLCANKYRQDSLCCTI